MESITKLYNDVPNGVTFAMYESIVSYVITLVTMARFIGLLPPVESIDDI